MNATSLYVSACRLVMQNPLDDNSSLIDLCKAIPSLRQALSCTVCCNLLIEPYTPTESSCQHHVCRACRGEKKKLKPSCSWCKDYSKYYENAHLRTLLQCYKKLCVYVTNSNLLRDLVALSTSSSNSNIIDSCKLLVAVVKEGAGFKDEYNDKVLLNATPFCQNLFCDVTTQTGSSSPTESKPLLTNGLYSCIYTGTGNRLTIKRETDPFMMDEKTYRVTKLRKKSAFGLMVTSCRCVGASSKLTCRGYRCPCYSVDRPCVNCQCKLCNNPIGANPQDSWEDYVNNLGNQPKEEPTNLLEPPPTPAPPTTTA